MADWEDLPIDLLISIAERLIVIEDVVAFGAVCRSWRLASTVAKETYVRSTKVPWLMLADKKRTKIREFYSLSKAKFYKVFLPEVKAKRCFSSRGWIITIGRDWAMDMLNPLSRVKLKLPHMNTFKYLEDIRVYYMYANFVTKVVLSSDPSSTSDYMVMVIYGYKGKLAFARAKGNAWNTVEATNAPCQYCEDLICYNNKFYALTTFWEVIACNVQDPGQVELISKVPDGMISRFYYGKQYLVESAGSLLVVSREGQQRSRDGLVREELTESFQVLRLNTVDGSWTELDSLGDRVLFLGDNSSFSIPAIDIPGIKPDHIYYTDDFSEAFFNTTEGGGRDTGVYSMQHDIADRCFNFGSYSHFSPPIWVEPSF